MLNVQKPLGIAVAISLLGCSDPMLDLVPNRPGLVRIYQASFFVDGELTTTGYDESTSLPATELNGQRVYPIQERHIGSDRPAAMIFRAVDDRGLASFAYQAPGATEPEIDVSLLLPRKTESGQSWTEEGPIRWLSFPGMPEESPGRYNVRIEEIDTSVTVEAGTFDGCVKKLAEAVPDGPKTGNVKARSETNASWYCRGVGLAKFVRTMDGNAWGRPVQVRMIYQLSEVRTPDER